MRANCALHDSVSFVLFGCFLVMFLLRLAHSSLLRETCHSELIMLNVWMKCMGYANYCGRICVSLFCRETDTMASYTNVVYFWLLLTAVCLEVSVPLCYAIGTWYKSYFTCVGCLDHIWMYAHRNVLCF